MRNEIRRGQAHAAANRSRRTVWMIPETMILKDGQEITVIHFLAQPKWEKPRIACMPGLKDFSANQYRECPFLRTDEVRSVTCPTCKGTEDFKKAEQVLIAAVGDYRR